MDQRFHIPYCTCTTLNAELWGTTLVFLWVSTRATRKLWWKVILKSQSSLNKETTDFNNNKLVAKIRQLLPIYWVVEFKILCEKETDAQID